MWQVACDAVYDLFHIGQPYKSKNLADWWSTVWYEVKLRLCRKSKGELNA